MSRILLLESDPKCLSEILDAFKSISPSHTIINFNNFFEFEENIKVIQNDEEKTDFLKFDLVVLDYSLIPQYDWKEKLNSLRENYTGSTTYCFTTFENVSVNRKYVLSLHVFNIIYKPFDPLILKESLNLALNAKSNVKPLEMQAQQVTGFVGILKEIELMSTCELGFVTMSDVAIPINSISKYFSIIFSRGKKQSVWAQCLLSLEIPNKPGLFINKFQYVGIEEFGLMQLRRYIHANKSNRSSNAVWNLVDSKNKNKVHIAIIDKIVGNASQLKSEIEKHFTNVCVDFIKIDDKKILSTVYLKYEAVICRSADLMIDSIKKSFKNEALFFLLLDGQIDEEKFKTLQPHYRDVFVHPLDRGYFYKKLKFFIHDAELQEPVELVNVNTTEKMKVANLVKISEICELYINFNYHRELPHGDFREFAFIGDDENQITELPAFCNFVEKETSPSQQKSEGFLHQFVFWGMTDRFLKEIRIWLLHNYIIKNQSKD